MANKSNLMSGVMDAAATLETIAKGTPDAKNAKNVKNVPNIKDAPKKPGRKPKYEADMERLNLKIPKELKEHLTIAAAKASIDRKVTVSLTEYLCELIEADMLHHKK